MVLRYMAEEAKRLDLHPRSPIKITILDQRGFLGQGLAYGPAGTDGALLNHTFREFLPREELIRMKMFIEATHKDWLPQFYNSPDPAAVEWARKFGASMRSGEYEHLFLPRKIYGLYFRQALLSALSEVKEQKVFELHYSQAEVENIHILGDSYCVSCASNARTHVATKVVLSSGGTYRNAEPELGANYIPNLFQPSFEENISHIEAALASPKCPQGARSLVIMGGGASAHELLYTLRYRPSLLRQLDKIMVVSPYGGVLDASSQNIHSTSSTQQLVDDLERFFSRESGQINTAASLIDGVVRGLDYVSQLGHSLPAVAPFLKPILGRILTSLPECQRQLFVSQYSPVIERILRRTSEPYSNEVRRLQAEGRIEIIKGKVADLKFDGQDYTVSLAEAGENSTLRASVVVDARGHVPLKQVASSGDTLFGRLVQKQYIEMNGSSSGVSVSNDYEAGSGIHVIGPMLAGSIVSGNLFWNTSGARSVYAVAKPLAHRLLSDLSNASAELSAATGD